MTAPISMNFASSVPGPGRGMAASSAGRSVLDELLTARQVAALLQMKVSTVEAYARRGLLPSVKLGRHRRFIQSQLESALDEIANEHRA
jgi:excisionase family DNA binding protein